VLLSVQLASQTTNMLMDLLDRSDITSLRSVLKVRKKNKCYIARPLKCCMRWCIEVPLSVVSICPPPSPSLYLFGFPSLLLCYSSAQQGDPMGVLGMIKETSAVKVRLYL